MRFHEFKLTESKLFEAEARIQHAEDVVFWEGSKGDDFGRLAHLKKKYGI